MIEQVPLFDVPGALTRTKFEALLSRAALFLTTNLRTSTLYHGPEQLQQGVLAAVQNAATDLDVQYAKDRGRAGNTRMQRCIC